MITPDQVSEIINGALLALAGWAVFWACFLALRSGDDYYLGIDELAAQAEMPAPDGKLFQGAAVESPTKKKKSHGWLRPELKVGMKVLMLMPPYLDDSSLLEGEIISRGSRRARILTEDNQKFRRSVKNLCVISR